MLQLTSTIAGSIPANALKVLVVLMLERVPCNKGYLETVTDMSDKTLAKALDQLMLRGMVTHNGGHVYQIASGVQQLPLMARELEEPQEEAVDKPVDNSVDNVFDITPDDPQAEKSRKYSDFSLNESKNESMNQINDEDDSFIDGAVVENSGAENERPTAAALKALGFYGRGITEMLAIPGLTMREVRYHVEDAPGLGAALARIKKRQSVPENWGRDGPNERKKYSGGPYADFIVH